MKTLFVVAIAMLMSSGAFASESEHKMLCDVSRSETPHVIDFRLMGMKESSLVNMINSHDSPEWKRTMSKLAVEIVYDADIDLLVDNSTSDVQDAVFGICMMKMRGDM